MSYLSVCLADAPAAIWLCTEAAGILNGVVGAVIDSSGNARGGTPSGITSGVAGPGGDLCYSLSPGSSSYVALPFGAWMTPGTGDLTIETWINTTATESSPYAFSGTDGLTTLWGLNFDTGNQKPQFRLGSTNITGPAAVNDGNWHYLAGVRQSGVGSLYLDGAVIATGASTDNIAGLTISNIGRFTTSLYWNGLLCRCAYYPTALSAARVSAHFTAGGGGPGPATQLTLSGPASGIVGVASTNFTVTPNGTATETVTLASSGSGTFTPASPLTFSASSAAKTFTYTPSTLTGSPHSISISASPPIAIANSPIPYTVTAGTVTPGLITLVSTPTTITPTIAASTGTNTYAWSRAAASNILPGQPGSTDGIATGLTFTDTPGGVGGTIWYYHCTVTNTGTSATGVSNVAAGDLLYPPVVIGYIGDSITYGGGLTNTCSDMIAFMGGRRLTGTGLTPYNQGVSGRRMQDWASNFAGEFSAAMAVFAGTSPRVTHVHVMLGVNDAAGTHESPATFGSQAATLAANIITAGFVPVFADTGFFTVGCYGGYDEAALALIPQYSAALDAVCNGTTIFRGDRLGAFHYFAEKYAIGSANTADGLHPASAALVPWGQLWAAGMLRSMPTLGGGGAGPAPPAATSKHHGQLIRGRS